jgi:hypothetical protein
MVKKVIIDSNDKMMSNILVLSKRMDSIENGLEIELCKMKEEIVSYVNNVKVDVMFDSIMRSIRNEELSSSILDYSDLIKFTNLIPQLKHSE